MDSRKRQFMAAVLGPDGATALTRAAERSSVLENAIVPRTVIAWLQASSEYEGELPGIKDSYVAFEKSEQGFTGSISIGETLHKFQDESLFHVAASVGVALGIDEEAVSPEIRDVEIQRLGKSINLLAKARMVAAVLEEDLKKFHPPPEFPELGIWHRSQVPILSTPNEVNSKVRAVVADIRGGRPVSNFKKLATSLKDGAGPMGATSPKPGSSLGYALNDNLIHNSDPVCSKTPLATQHHENFHVMMNEVRAKYGHEGTFHVLSELHQAIDPKDWSYVDYYGRAASGIQSNRNPHYAEEILANMHDYLNDPSARENFHKLIAPGEERAYGDAIKRAHRAVSKRAASITHDEVRKVIEAGQGPKKVVKEELAASEDLEKGREAPGPSAAPIAPEAPEPPTPTAPPSVRTSTTQGPPKPPTAPVPKSSKPLPTKTIKLNRSEASHRCPACGIPQIAEGEFTGCFCLRDLKKSVSTEVTENGFVLHLLGDGWDRDTVLTLLEAVGRE